MELTNKQKWIMGGIGTLVIMLFTVAIWNHAKKADETEQLGWEENTWIEETESAETVDKEEQKKEIMVHVTGEIKIDGVVVLEEGSRVIDAINAAGGTTEEADLSQLNLAYVIEDGQKIEVPNKEETSKREYITSDSGDTVSGKTEKTSKGEDQSMVNINTANQAELETIPGVGPSTALKILEYRKENGTFKSVEDIKNVKGIGDAKYESMKQHITV